MRRPASCAHDGIAVGGVAGVGCGGRGSSAEEADGGRSSRIERVGRFESDAIFRMGGPEGGGPRCRARRVPRPPEARAEGEERMVPPQPPFFGFREGRKGEGTERRGVWGALFRGRGKWGGRKAGWHLGRR